MTRPHVRSGQPGFGGDPTSQPAVAGTSHASPPAPATVPAPATGSPRKRRTGLVVGLVTGVLVLLLGAGTAFGYLTSRGASSPEEAVQGFMEAIFTDEDVAAAKAYVCDKEAARWTDPYEELFGGDGRAQATWSRLTVKSNDGTQAVVALYVELDIWSGGRHTHDVDRNWTFEVLNQDSAWKIC